MVSFFSLPFWILGEIRAKLKELFNLNCRRLRTQYPDTRNTLIVFLSAAGVMQVIFWTKDNFCFISDCRNSFNCKLKKFISEQIIFFLWRIKCTLFIWRIRTDKRFQRRTLEILKKLLTYFLCSIIWSENFLSENFLFYSEKNASFIYSIITLFSKIGYYLSSLSQKLKLTSL